MNDPVGYWGALGWLILGGVGVLVVAGLITTSMDRVMHRHHRKG
jgi:hypothetical protein